MNLTVEFKIFEFNLDFLSNAQTYEQIKLNSLVLNVLQCLLT